MKRREFITGIGSAVAWAVAARAQRADLLPSVTLFSPGSEGDVQFEAARAAFTEALAKLGWTDGRNIRIEHRWGRGDAARMRVLAAEIAGRAPNAILAFGTQVTSLLKQQTATIPIVFVNAADPVSMGFAASFAHPGGNITGFTSVEFSFASKWLGLLRDVVPGLANVMVLYTPDNPNLTGFLRTIEAAAKALQVNFHATSVTTAAELAHDIEAFVAAPAAGMIVLPGGRTTEHRETIVSLASRHHLPAVYPYRYFAETGGLASYGSDDFDVIRRSAGYIDRILKGEKAADLPVQAPTKFELVINLKTARAIGLIIPPTLLALADEVIE